jgi:hypothetical protein
MHLSLEDSCPIDRSCLAPSPEAEREEGFILIILSARALLRLLHPRVRILQILASLCAKPPTLLLAEAQFFPALRDCSVAVGPGCLRRRRRLECVIAITVRAWSGLLGLCWRNGIAGDHRAGSSWRGCFRFSGAIRGSMRGTEIFRADVQAAKEPDDQRQKNADAGLGKPGCVKSHENTSGRRTSVLLARSGLSFAAHTTK